MKILPKLIATQLLGKPFLVRIRNIQKKNRKIHEMCLFNRKKLFRHLQLNGEGPHTNAETCPLDHAHNIGKQEFLIQTHVIKLLYMWDTELKRKLGGHLQVPGIISSLHATRRFGHKVKVHEKRDGP